MSFTFQKATRKKARLRLAIQGPSGSGKTFSALELASGIAKRIAVIDTEHNSASLYSDRFEFDTLELSPPFSPERYRQAIEAAEQAGYDLVIIDSFSHAWAGEGGILEMHEKISKVERNSYTAWAKVTPEQNKLVEAILRSPIHIIACMRKKTAYEIVDNEKGKKEPRKLGLAPIQRDGVEYEFTTVLDLEVEGNIATSSKDRTGIFAGFCDKLTRKKGADILAWLERGEDDIAAVKDSFAKALTIEDLKILFSDFWRSSDKSKRPAIQAHYDARKKQLEIVSHDDDKPPTLTASPHSDWEPDSVDERLSLGAICGKVSEVFQNFGTDESLEELHRNALNADQQEWVFKTLPEDCAKAIKKHNKKAA